ncbi:unnamed protein product [Echinostoma caproni]|uniref:SAM domain-containing protein n=1 Tax=Echinostoma caproni TaxID=27848 RepID=A0A183AZV6_9TREM|nr:unnamed protein product [Echinostoma caproni]
MMVTFFHPTHVFCLFFGAGVAGIAVQPDDDGPIWHVLKAADALDYLPNFRYHRITCSQLNQLTDDDLQRIGVHSVGTRLAILNQISESVTEQIKFTESSNPLERATAPPPEPEHVTPFAPPKITARVENECCVCQNSTVSADHW